MASKKNRVVETIVRTGEVKTRLGRFLGADVGYLKETTGPEQYPGGLTLAHNAVIHENGWEEGGIPPRPFMRQGVERFEGDARNIGVILSNVVEGKFSPEIANNALGVLLQNHIRLAIRHGDFVPNKPATIRRKGSSKPLIDSGKLRQGVDVRTKG